MFEVQNDEPTLQDKLKRGQMVTRVGDEVAACAPPCVFGVHGEWGSGKTSFLHQLHWYLTGDCPQQSDDERKAAGTGNGKQAGRYENDVTIVWFEAWRYQHENDPVIALLHEIRTQLPLYSKWLNEGRKLTAVAIRGALLSMEDLTKRIGFKASKVQEAGEQWERENLAVALPSHTIRQHLNEALRQLLGKKSGKRRNARLVVLIDDLDRCEPAAAFKLLEGIKIYLNLSSCVFVLGMNQRIIERAIAKHTAPDESDDIRHEYAREYLDKLCTNIWHLPLLDNPATLLGQWLPTDLARRELFLGVMRTHRCVAANPRKIKSFANVLLRFAEHLGVGGLHGDWIASHRLLVLMACLYHDHYELYRMIESEPTFYNLMRQWATGIVPVDPEKKAPHELLCRLRLAMGFKETDVTEREPTPASKPYSTFADPVRGNVFRLQSLVRELGEVKVSELRRYLLSGTAGEQGTQDSNE